MASSDYTLHVVESTLITDVDTGERTGTGHVRGINVLKGSHADKAIRKRIARGELIKRPKSALPKAAEAKVADKD